MARYFPVLNLNTSPLFEAQISFAGCVVEFIALSLMSRKKDFAKEVVILSERLVNRLSHCCRAFLTTCESQQVCASQMT